MEIAEAIIFNQEDISHDDNDEHENDMVMPGFRFRPTEEELVEFYLRRKVEGKHFNIELITFVDLYHYDPWELPALAAIGEKEWYFYVPRDRKYRNGDRPNRLTASGYWKATGVDRLIRGDNVRSIGVKKTLVFYAGKAPKGIRTGWIMNEYRLPQRETQHLLKGEISLCRVYKRAGIKDPPSLPKKAQSWYYSSRMPQLSSHQTQNNSHGQGFPNDTQAISESVPSTTADIGPDNPALLQQTIDNIDPLPPVAVSPDESCCRATGILYQSDHTYPPTIPTYSSDDLHRLVNSYTPHQSASANCQFHANNIPSLLSELQAEPPLAHNAIPESCPEAYADALLDWSDSFGAGDYCSNLFMQL